MEYAPNSGSIEQKTFKESVTRSVFVEWCKMNGVANLDIPETFNSIEKVTIYDSVFRLGAQKFLNDFLAQTEDVSLDLDVIKLELDSLRVQGDLVALGLREQEVAAIFQKAISAYKYNEITSHPADILNKKEMNCVGASLIGGMLLEKVGIRCVLAGGGAHTFLIVVTSDNRVLWQDMQDGKERPESNNQELTTERISGINEQGVTVVPLDIVAFARDPKEEGMTFKANIEHWRDESITVKPFLFGIEEQELINTGFMFTNNGKHREAIEILEIAMQKSPNTADVYLGLAKALRGLGRYEEAILKCKKALEIDPTYSYVQNEMNGIRKQLEDS